MTDPQVLEVDLDPLGFVARPDLYVRNLSPQTITFNMGDMHWSLPPWPDTNYEQPLPWTVARSAGFLRLWGRQQVLVAVDTSFTAVITELPEAGAPGSSGAGAIFKQETPQSVTDLTHDFNRDGPVLASIFSLDGSIEYYNFGLQMLDKNTIRISFDDPTAFMATVF